MEVRTPSDGFAATFPKGDGFYPDKLKFTDLLTARALSFQLSTAYPGIGVATRPQTEICRLVYGSDTLISLKHRSPRHWCRHAALSIGVVTRQNVVCLDRNYD